MADTTNTELKRSDEDVDILAKTEFEAGTPDLEVREKLRNARQHIGWQADELARLIKERDDARADKEHTELLERTIQQMTSLLADAEVERLEARLELAKERARQARQATLESGLGRPVAVYAITLGPKAKANGKDA